MNARQSLQNRIFESKSFTYIPDPEGKDFIDALANDRWETAREVEDRGGADCDGLSVRAIVRGYDAAHEGDWYLVAGVVLIRGQWLGHCWVELVTDHDRLWADPTWGWLPKSPTAHGFPTSRRPSKRWRYDSAAGIFTDEETYVTAVQVSA